MNPKKKKSPKIEVTTQNETLDVELPDGSKVSSMRIDGREVHQTYCLVTQMSQFRKCWLALGVFCTLMTVSGTIMGAWMVKRILQLPSHTEEFQQLLDYAKPPAFRVGHFVKIEDGKYGQIVKIQRDGGTSYAYKVGSDKTQAWHPQATLTYVRESRDSRRRIGVGAISTP